jgi:hypothetical protein
MERMANPKQVYFTLLPGRTFLIKKQTDILEHPIFAMYSMHPAYSA